MTAYTVRCADHDTNPTLRRDVAERQLEQIVAAGHCRLEHEVVEVTT